MRHPALALALAALLAMAGAPRAHAADIAIGAIYPLTGPGAQVGLDAKAALEVAQSIINDTHDPIPMLLGQGGGLTHLGGAHIKVVLADSQNDPQKARAEAERLITQEHVVAILGSYTSATAATISQVTERYQVPYMSADNSSPALNRRGLHWFFRTSPTDEDFSAAMFAFFKDEGAKTGRPVHSVALIHEDSIFGTDSAATEAKLAQEAGITVAADIRYRANSSSLSVEVQQLQAANADVVMPSSYTSDAILMVQAMHSIGYEPKALLAQAAGFQEQDFITATGTLAEGVMSRSSFALDSVISRPAIGPVNRMYSAHNQKNLNDNTAREITALLVLADAIDRAGSTEPEAIRHALTTTNIPGDRTIMPWRGIRFDDTGQNTLGTPVIQQVLNGAYRTIYPADVATTEAIWNVGK